MLEPNFWQDKNKSKNTIKKKKLLVKNAFYVQKRLHWKILPWNHISYMSPSYILGGKVDEKSMKSLWRWMKTQWKVNESWSKVNQKLIKNRSEIDRKSIKSGRKSIESQSEVDQKLIKSCRKSIESWSEFNQKSIARGRKSIKSLLRIFPISPQIRKFSRFLDKFENFPDFLTNLRIFPISWQSWEFSWFRNNFENFGDLSRSLAFSRQIWEFS